MANVLGECGRYVSNQAVVKFQSMLKTALIMMSILSAVGGLAVGLAIRGANLPLWFSAVLNTTVILAICVIWRKGIPKLDLLVKEREHMRRGASGESAVAFILANLPDGYHVINDLTTPFGNLDHVVIGPTGVFVIDTKNWRGVAKADGKGELLQNGKPTDKPLVRHFVARIMGIKEKVRVLSPEIDPFFQAVFVFTSARVEANWGSTKSVHCMCDDQLVDYVTDTKFRRELKQNEIEQIARAFQGLAQMDKGFSTSLIHIQPKPELQTA